MTVSFSPFSKSGYVSAAAGCMAIALHNTAPDNNGPSTRRQDISISCNSRSVRENVSASCPGWTVYHENIR